MQNQRMPKQTAAGAMEERSKRERPRKRWRDEVEEVLNILGIKFMQTMVIDLREWRKIVLEAKGHSGL